MWITVTHILIYFVKNHEIHNLFYCAHTINKLAKENIDRVMNESPENGEEFFYKDLIAKIVCVNCFYLFSTHASYIIFRILYWAILLKNRPNSTNPNGFSSKNSHNVNVFIIRLTTKLTIYALRSSLNGPRVRVITFYTIY